MSLRKQIYVIDDLDPDMKAMWARLMHLKGLASWRVHQHCCELGLCNYFHIHHWAGSHIRSSEAESNIFGKYGSHLATYSGVHHA